MTIPIRFITPTARIPFQALDLWYDTCARALAGQVDAGQEALLALTICTNQVSLIYSFASDLSRAEHALAQALTLLRPHSLASDKLRLATASLHMNLARLALRKGASDVVSENIGDISVAEGCGEDEIHGNFIAYCNAHEVALLGQDASYFCRHSEKCGSCYARDIKTEAETIFLIRQGRWTEAKCSATRDISDRWDSNIVRQQYALLIDWLKQSMIPRIDELSLMFDEIELEESKSVLAEISTARLLLRLCGVAGICNASIYERALDVTERVGARHGDHYLANLRRWLQKEDDMGDPFHVEVAYGKALHLDAEQLIRKSRAYEDELLHFAERAERNN